MSLKNNRFLSNPLFRFCDDTFLLKEFTENLATNEDNEYLKRYLSQIDSMLKMLIHASIMTKDPNYKKNKSNWKKKGIKYTQTESRSACNKASEIVKRFPYFNNIELLEEIKQVVEKESEYVQISAQYSVLRSSIKIASLDDVLNSILDSPRQPFVIQTRSMGLFLLGNKKIVYCSLPDYQFLIRRFHLPYVRDVDPLKKEILNYKKHLLKDRIANL